MADNEGDVLGFGVCCWTAFMPADDHEAVWTGRGDPKMEDVAPPAAGGNIEDVPPAPGGNREDVPPPKATCEEKPDGPLNMLLPPLVTAGRLASPSFASF